MELRFGKNRGQNIEELDLVSTAQYYNWYKKAVDKPNDAQKKYIEENREYLKALKARYVELLKTRLMEQMDEITNEMNAEGQYCIVNTLFIKSSYNHPVTYYALSGEEVPLETLLKVNKSLNKLYNYVIEKGIKISA